MSKMISEFQGEYRWLSNFWPVSVFADGLIYPSVEHAFVAGKTDDINFKLQCTEETLSAAQVKKLGQKVQLRPGWNEVKLGRMRNCLKWKFDKNEHPDLYDKLLATGDVHLQEGNYWGDIYWGVSTVSRFFKKHGRLILAGEGENHLGKLLMEIRSTLKL